MLLQQTRGSEETSARQLYYVQMSKCNIHSRTTGGGDLHKGTFHKDPEAGARKQESRTENIP